MSATRRSRTARVLRKVVDQTGADHVGRARSRALGGGSSSHWLAEVLQALGPVAYHARPDVQPEVDPELESELFDLAALLFEWLMTFQPQWHLVCGAVSAERIRQDLQYGPVDTAEARGLDWLDLLGEEVGEVARALVERRWQVAPRTDLQRELEQTLAVAVRWLEWLELQREGSA